MSNLLLIMLLIFVGQTLGSLIGLIRKPSEIVLHASLAFAASMMLCISFFQLVPEALKIISFVHTVLFFLLGMMMMHFVDHLLPHINPGLLKKEKPAVEKTVIMLVIGIALHNLPEGLAIGSGFALNPTLGIAIALGIASQDVPENIATIVPLYAWTKKRMKSFIITTGTIAFEVAGFIIGYYILRGTSLNLLGSSLALAAGFMTYISIEELIPAAEIKQYPRVSIISVLSGVICVLLIIPLGR